MGLPLRKKETMKTSESLETIAIYHPKGSEARNPKVIVNVRDVEDWKAKGWLMAPPAAKPMAAKPMAAKPSVPKK